MEISFGELLLICLIAFLVLGPKELVLRANQLGRWLGKMRTEMNNFKIMAQEQILKAEDFKGKLEQSVEPIESTKSKDRS